MALRRRELSAIERAYIRGADAAGRLYSTKLMSGEIAELATAEYRTPHNFHPISRSCAHRAMQGTTFVSKRPGRPRKTTPAQDDGMKAALLELQEECDEEVTAKMVRHRLQLFDVHPQLISRRLRVDFGFGFLSVPRNLNLLDSDIVDRLEFATTWKDKPLEFWTSRVGFMDNKKWTPTTTAAARKQALTDRVRGMYRLKGKKGHPAPCPKSIPHKYKHRDGGGHRAIEICACFGGGRCLFAVEVSVERGWCAAEYCKVAENELYALESKYVIIRDNDPKGYSSQKGVRAEMDNGVPVVPLPKRSPGLQAMDYTFHSQIRRKMDEHTKNWPSDRVETVAEYKARLLDTYRSLPEAAVNAGCADMRRRLREVYDAEGRNIKHE